MPNDTFNINIGNNTGYVIPGNHNTVNLMVAPLALPPPQAERVESALQALRDGRQDNDDAKALQAAASVPDETTRAEKIKDWLLKVAPHAAQLAGSIVNPVVGEVAKAATAWAARALGNAPGR
jgi:hypothetical protein